jgi:P-loop Domain of unknown function (DUF2791)
MNATLPRPKAVQVLKALRSGSTPAAFALELAVGQTPWFQTALQLLDELADCEHFDVRFVRARYGGGKTHFLRCLQSEAKARGWATAYVLLKHGEVELDQFNTIVAEIADKLELPDKKRGLPALLKQALIGIAKRNGYDPAGPFSFKTRERAQRAVSNFVQEHGLGYQFNLALQVCIYALLEKDDLLLAQFANWLAGGGESLTVDPNELSSSPNQPKTKASRTILKPLGLGDAEQLIRLFALLVNEAGYNGLYLAIDEVELLSGQTSRRRNNSFQTLRALVDESDENLMPPSTCLYLAATPDMFENPELFPSYKALQDRIEALPSLSGDATINYRAPVVNLDSTELGEEDLRALADKVVEVFRSANGEPNQDALGRIGKLVSAVAKGNYVIARPRLLCRCMVELLEGHLGADLRQELASRTEEMRKEREREIKGK